MTAFSILTLWATFFVASRLVSSAPAPIPVPANTDTATTSSYWLSSITRQGTVAFGDSSYQIFRNVQDFGAKGDGK